MRDMTTGTAQHLWRYAVPILLGNWLQLADNDVDSNIAGRFIGKEALAAEGSFQGFYRGMGKIYTTVLGTAIQISIRTAVTFLQAPQMGIVVIAYACAAGWTVMLLFEVPYYLLQKNDF